MKISTMIIIMLTMLILVDANTKFNYVATIRDTLVSKVCE